MASPSVIHQSVIQSVKVLPDGSTQPDVFTISKQRNQMVRWEAAEPGTYFTVEFKDQSPFYESQFSADFPYSGIIRRDVLGDRQRQYKYTVRINGNEVDPRGVIEP